MDRARSSAVRTRPLARGTDCTRRNKAGRPAQRASRSVEGRDSDQAARGGTRRVPRCVPASGPAAAMKCPKCQYISFESSERCRNCGYEFSLAIDSAGFDLPIQTGKEALGPLSDFSLERLDDPEQSAVSSPGAGAPSGSLADFGATPQPRPITSPFDLPLLKQPRPECDVTLDA